VEVIKHLFIFNFKAMKSFFKKSLYFSLPIILFILLFDFYLRGLNTIYTEKIDGLLKNKDSIEILILGNSHANYGIDPEQFTFNAYNLACVDQSLYFDKRLTLKYIDSLPKLKFVLINIDYHSLYFSKQEKGVRDIWSYYGNGIKYKNRNYFKYDVSPFIFGYKPKISFSVLKGGIKKWIKNEPSKLVFGPQKGVKPNSNLQKGFIAYENTNESKFNDTEYSNRANSFTDRVNKSTENTDVIQDASNFIEILKSKNITPIIVSIPCYSEFTKRLDQKIIKKNNAQINNLAKKYSIEYWDYLNFDSLSKSDFYNSDHLNKKGAAKFSKILNKRIKDFTQVKP